MPRPPGKNYERNRKRLLKSLEGQGFQVLPPSSSKENFSKNENTYDPAKLNDKQFAGSPLYPLTRSFMKGLALSRKESKENRAVLYDSERRLQGDGVIYRPQWRIPYSELRAASENTSIAGAIHQMRADDARLHGQLSEELGFWFASDEEKEKNKDLKRIKELGQMLVRMGKKTGSAWQERDCLPDVLEMATRDVLAIDRTAYLLSRTRGKEILSIQYLDPATVFCTDPNKGYKGDKKITHVQVVNGRIVETFEAGQIYLRSKNKRSDIRSRYEGLSPVESCITELLAMVHALKNNMDRFNKRKPPSMIMTTKSALSDQARQLLEELWENFFAGESDQFRFPLLDGLDNLEVHRLGTENDMIFERLMKWVSTLIFIRHGTDPAELGMKLESNQSLAEPSLDGRAKLSRDRAHGAIMRFHESCIVDLLDIEMQDKPMRFYFAGTTTENKDHILDRNIKKLSNFLPLAKVLNEMGLPKYSEMVKELLPDDEDAQEKSKKLDLAILNPQFMNIFTQTMMAPPPEASAEEEEGYDDEGEDYEAEGEEESEAEQEGQPELDDEGNLVG